MFGEDDAWALIRDLRRTARGGRGMGPCDAPADASHEARTLLELFQPLCSGQRGDVLVVAHLGQSLDGRVATPNGVSRFITGDEDLRHTHRLRALFDAVVVGAGTVAADDPRLTTRLVPGEQPVRVVLDPRARVPLDRHVYTDGAAPTWVVVGKGFEARYAPAAPRVEVLAFELEGDRLPLADVLDVLRARGLCRIFVEGGGVTVSRFLDAGLLDRLQIAVAPKLIGTGAPALDLAVTAGGAAQIPAETRRFLLGPDVLFDCDLRASRGIRERT